jgi:glycerate dehydrogenase
MVRRPSRVLRLPRSTILEPPRLVGELEVFDRTAQKEVLDRAGAADAILTVRKPLLAQTLIQLKRLRYIGAMFTGYDEIDLKAARDLKIVVTNVSTCGTASVAQLAFALVIDPMK